LRFWEVQNLDPFSNMDLRLKAFYDDTQILEQIHSIVCKPYSNGFNMFLFVSLW